MSGRKRPHEDTRGSSTSKRLKQSGQQDHPQLPSTSSASSHSIGSVPFQCEHCSLNIITHQQTILNLDGEMNDLVTKGTSEKLSEFYRKVNSLVNGKGGILVIHATSPHKLGLFDQKIDQKLSDQITTGALYQDVFRRFFYDENHILYEIKAVSGKRPLGALEMNTRISHNKGKDKPSYTQTRFLLDKFQKKKPPPKQRKGREFLFEDGKEAHISLKPPNRNEVKEAFQESAFVQAKEVREGQKTNFSTEELVDYCWKFLPEYVSSFTKSEEGGCVFFGVCEQTQKKKAWSSVPQHRCVEITRQGKTDGWELWEQNGSTVMHATIEKHVPLKEEKSGTFEVLPVYLPEAEREKFRGSILDKVDKEMMWVALDSSQYSNPVEVHFPKVKNALPDYCVIEVKINYYHGLCFYKKEGPEVYRLGGPNSDEPKRVNVKDWIKSFDVDCDINVRP